MKAFGIFLYSFLKKKYGHEIKKRRQETTYQYQIELDCGEPINIKGFKHYEFTNKLVSTQNLKTFAFFLFFKQFERIGVLIYYILMILHLSFLHFSQEDLIVYIVPLMMHFILQVSKTLYFDYCKIRYDQLINKRNITKFRRLRKEFVSKSNQDIKQNEPQQKLEKQVSEFVQKKHTQPSSVKKKDKIPLYENTTWDNLEVGDMVYLKRNEFVPADVLVVDISDEIFQIQSQNINGATSETQKYPTSLTVLKNSKNKIQGFDYKKILTGLIQYDRNSQGELKGFVKLKKDPKGESITRQNILFREEKLRTCQYAIGVILFAGQFCQCYQNIGNRDKKSFFVQKSRMFFFLTLLISLMITLITWLIASFSICQNETQNYFETTTLIFYLTQYVKATPIFFYNCIDLLEMATAHFKYYKFKHELGDAHYPKSNGESNQSQQEINYQQLNSASVGDLVMTEYVCFDKTGTLTSGDFRIRAIIIDDVMYKFSYSQLQKNTWGMFKENYLQQIKSNPNFRINEMDEDDEIQIEEKKGRSTGIFKMTLNNGTINRPSMRQSKNNSNVFTQDKQLISQDIASNKSISIQQNFDDLNIVENLRPEDLDDTHCKITPDLRTNKPKPFFNKSIVVNNNSISIQQSPPLSPYEEIQLIQQQSFKEENRSIYSQKKQRSDSDATLRKEKRQISINKRSYKDKDDYDQEVELVFQRDQEFFQKLVHGPSKYNYQEAILALILCQEVTSRYNNMEDNFVHDSTSFTFDQELVRFAAQFDFKFICANEHNGKINYVIDLLGEVYEFQILAINPEKPNHPRLGILVQFPEKLSEEFGYSQEQDLNETTNDISCVLIVREELNQLPANVDMDKFTREYWDKVFAKLHMQGMRTMVYSKIYLKEKDKNDFLDKYSTLRFSEPDELIQLFNEIEKDMQIIQVIGIKEKIRPDVRSLIFQMKQADLSLFILSGDDSSRVLPVAYKSGILNTQDIILNLDSDNIKLAIKNHLAIMTQQLKIQYQTKSSRLNTSEKFHKSMTSVAGDEHYSLHKHSRRSSKSQVTYGEIKAYSILLSGECFSLIQQDTSLYSHFSYLLYFCNSLITYKLSSHQKAEIIQIIQTQFQGNKKVLAIGDGYNDIAMFKQANLGIQYCHFPTSYLSYSRTNTRKKLTHKLSCLNNNKYLDNPLRKTHYQREIWVIPTADICVTTFDDLCALLFFESRIYAEVYDDLLVFSFYRSLLIIYLLFFVSAMKCSENLVLLEGGWLTVYQSVLLFIQQIASLVSKLSRNMVRDGIMYKEQFKGNIKTFKKKKVLSFVFKINGNAMLDASLLFISLYTLEFIKYPNGTVRQMLFLLLITSDIIKLSASTIFRYFTWLSLIFAYIICWITVALVSVVYTFDNNIETFEQLFTLPTSWFSLLFYISAQFCLSVCIEILQPLFSQGLIESEQDYLQISTILPLKHKNTYKKYHNLIKRIAVIAGKIFKKNNDEMDISIQDIVSGSNLKVNSDKINHFTLRFMNKDTEMKFKRVSKILWLNYERYKLGLSLLFLEVMAILIYTFYNLEDLQIDLFFIMYILSISLNIILLFPVFSSIYSKHFFFINLIIILLRFLTKFITDFFNVVNVDGMFDILLSQSYLLVLLFSRVHIPLISFVLSGFSAIGFIRKYSSFSFHNTLYQVLNGDLVVLSTYVLVTALQYKLIKLEREQYMLAVTVNQETTQMTNVLAILLPKFIRDRINAKGVFEISENQGEVAILFCDICGFDDIIAEQKENIVTLLDVLFRAFDQLCSQNGMQKIETVGKTYMAAGGLKACDQGTKFANQNPVKRALQLAVEMQDYTKKFKFGQVGQIIIKIGIHYGRVIAGVIGHHKPQFSLIGDTVNTTSRVCSTGQDGQITLSSESYEEINIPEYQFIERRVNAKGKGELITYQVNTQVQRGQHKHTRKRIGLVPKNDVASKYRQQASIFSQQPHQNTEEKIDVSSKLISSDSDKELLKFKRRGNKGPTLLMRGLQQQQQQQQQQQMPSQLNVQQQLIGQVSIGRVPASHSNMNINTNQQENQESLSQLQNFKDDSFTEKSNILIEISQRLRRDIQIDYVEESPDYEIDVDKVKMYFDDDNQTYGEILQLEKKKLYLGFKDHQYNLAREFMEQNAAGRNIVLLTLLVHLLQYFVKSIGLFFVIDVNYSSQAFLIIVLRLISSFMLLILALLQNKKLKQKFYTQTYFISIYSFLLFCIGLEAIFLKDQEGFELQAAEGILLICFFCSISIIEISNKVIFILIFFLTQILIVIFKFEIWALAYYTILQSVQMFIVQYNIFMQDLNTFNNKRSLELKKSQSSNLVKYLLPNHILKQFLSNNNQRIVLTDNFDEATLLFADIAGFTEYSSRVQPEQVVNMLRNLFTEFDKKCLIMNTYKLYTIGDCYVVMGIVDVTQRNPAQEARNVVELGFQMIEIIRSVRQIIGFDGLDMRIGVHTGKVIGGILGTEIVRYDVYGADVMISNKMESNGERGRVQVSEETKQILEAAFPDVFTYTFNKLIEFKSINRKTNGYFIDLVNNDSNEAFNDMEDLGYQSQNLVEQEI